MMNSPLLVISLFALPWLTACGNEESCGPTAVVDSTVTATTSEGPVLFGQFTSSPNNDCSVAGSPTSLTVDATQQAPATTRSAFLTLCFPQPELIDGTPIALADDSLVQIIDVTSRPSESCLITLDRQVVAAGTLTITGLCGAGQDSEGYALAFDGSVGGTLQCDGDGGTTSTSVRVALGGEAAVAAPR